MFKLATQETKGTKGTKGKMQYTLVLTKREPMKFYVLEVAELYQSIYGGVLLNNDKPLLKLAA